MTVQIGLYIMNQIQAYQNIVFFQLQSILVGQSGLEHGVVVWLSLMIPIGSYITPQIPFYQIIGYPL